MELCQTVAYVTVWLAHELDRLVYDREVPSEETWRLGRRLNAIAASIVQQEQGLI